MCVFHKVVNDTFLGEMKNLQPTVHNLFRILRIKDFLKISWLLTEMFKNKVVNVFKTHWTVTGAKNDKEVIANSLIDAKVKEFLKSFWTINFVGLFWLTVYRLQLGLYRICFFQIRPESDFNGKSGRSRIFHRSYNLA